MKVDPAIHAQLAKQGLRRPLTQAEEDLAAALEDVFASGDHDFATVARHLSERQVARPSGASDPWSEAVLHSELEVINRSLDAVYVAGSVIAPYR